MKMENHQRGRDEWNRGETRTNGRALLYPKSMPRHNIENVTLCDNENEKREEKCCLSSYGEIKALVLTMKTALA